MNNRYTYKEVEKLWTKTCERLCQEHGWMGQAFMFDSERGLIAKAAIDDELRKVGWTFQEAMDEYVKREQEWEDGLRARGIEYDWMKKKDSNA